MKALVSPAPKLEPLFDKAYHPRPPKPHITCERVVYGMSCPRAWIDSAWRYLHDNQRAKVLVLNARTKRHQEE